MFIPYNPSIHKGRKLYEIQTEKLESGAVATKIKRSDISPQVAAQIPWYFLVKVK